ncbi:hypothetical protein K438DRAFT_1777088 [Mycena galopus ATCC 62051]|nr:hypothetical protein K438DRAFT_1777088 [Mycena galopus ATCC 62051]
MTVLKRKLNLCLHGFIRARLTRDSSTTIPASPCHGVKGKRGGCIVVMFGLNLRGIGRVGWASWRENHTQSGGHVLCDVDGIFLAFTAMMLDGSLATNPWALQDNGVLVLSNRAAPVHALEGSSPSNPWVFDKHGGLVLQGDEPTRHSTSDRAKSSQCPPAPHSQSQDLLQNFDAEVASGRLNFTRIRAARIRSNPRPRPLRNNDQNQAPRATPRGLLRVTNSTSSAATWLVIRSAAEKARQQLSP